MMPAPSPTTDFLGPAQRDDELGRLGPYRVTEVLGLGGMGQVFRAEDTRLRRTVAIKVMNRKFSLTTNSRKRFIEEARSMAAVHHDNVATIFEVGQHQKTPYMAMELLHGQTLEQLVAAGRRFDFFEIIEIARQTARGLDAAHQRGIVHRDIKPANLWMQTPQERIKILDFGLALAGTGVDHLASVGNVVGTLGYLSPEQACDEPVDERTDLYALGVVMYQLCSGHLPLQGRNVSSQLVAILSNPPIPFAEHGVSVPRPLADLIFRLLSREPGDRVATALQLDEQLGHVAEEIQHGQKAQLAIKLDPEHSGATKSKKKSRRQAAKEQSAQQQAVQRKQPVPKKQAALPMAVAGAEEADELLPGEIDDEFASNPVAEVEDRVAPEKADLWKSPWVRLGIPLVSATALLITGVSYLWSRPARVAQTARQLTTEPSASQNLSTSPNPTVASVPPQASARPQATPQVTPPRKTTAITAATLAPLVLNGNVEGSKETVVGNFVLFSLVLANQAGSPNEDPQLLHKNASKVASLATYLQQEGSTSNEQAGFPRAFSAKQLPAHGKEITVPMQIPTNSLKAGKYQVRFELQTLEGVKLSETTTELTIKDK